MLLHVGFLSLLLASWAFGGGATWARFLISCWGSLGVLLTVAVRRAADAAHERGHPATAAVVVPVRGISTPSCSLSCLNPSFPRGSSPASASLLAHTAAAHPGAAQHGPRGPRRWNTCGCSDAIYLSCFNLTLAIRRRRNVCAACSLVAVASTRDAAVDLRDVSETHLGWPVFRTRAPAPNPRTFSPPLVYAATTGPHIS